MEELAATALPFARAAVVVMFALLAAVALGKAPRTGRAGWWVAAAFGSLAVALLGNWVTETLADDLPGRWMNAWLLLILAFPYLLLRFTACFGSLPRWLEAPAAAAAAAVAVATLLLPPSALLGAHEPRWVTAYLAGAAVYWLLLSVVTVVRLWAAGHGQPTVARRRMKLMATATAVLTVALLGAALGGDGPVSVQLTIHVIALASAAVFGLGFHPIRLIRLSWRRAEEEHLRQGTMAVLRADTVEEVARQLLPPTVRIVGGAGAVMTDAGGRVVATHGDAPALGTDLGRAADASRYLPSREVIALGDGRGELIVWTSRYTPFFGHEEAGLLQTMGAIAGLAIERCELLEDEREQRAALEEAQREAEHARQEATKANTAKTEFLSRMSHELRTPLNAILGFGQLLELSQLEDEDREGVRHIVKAGRHLLALINDVLDLSRIEAGTLTISLEPVDTRELIYDAVALIQPMADNRSIRLSVDDAGCDVYVRTDRQRCRQILLNLLSNAVKYNHDGGTVGVRCARVSEERLRVSVRDSGPGIDAVRQQRLFEPFERLGAEASNVEGTGLGLALTKQLVERLGGSIGVETAPGQGATFWIELPVTDAPADSDEPAESPEASIGDGTHKLLLVEDNLANLRVVEAMLRRRPGITVLPAMQGGLAVELAYEHRPDVIVLDLHLPDVPGREVLHRLQADPRTRDIPVVIASADATPTRMRQLRQEGAFEYIPKPLDLWRFLDVVDAALARRGATRGGPTGDGRPDGTG